ncbi:MAG: ketopantoate reductase family protein [Methanomassiliicoccales archaeon]
MRIAVMGAGALGSLMGGLLSKDHRVTLIGRREHVGAIQENGLRIEGIEDLHLFPEAAESPEGIGEQDLIIITVKAYDTEEAVEEVRPLASNVPVMSMQNGLENGELLRRAFGDRGLVALTSYGATFLGPGRIGYAGRGETVIGSPAGNDELAGWSRELFLSAGIQTRITADIVPEMWMKCVVNACINPITALVRRENGRLLDPEPMQLVRELCEEGKRTARSHGIDLPDDPLDRVIGVIEDTRKNRSSMLQDVERGRRTEIDQINGAIVRKAEEGGVEVPVNRTLWRLVSSLGKD